MKKFITLILALVMSIGLAGCGGGSDASSSTSVDSSIMENDGFTSEEIANDAPSDPTGDDGGLNTDDMTKDQLQDYVMSQIGGTGGEGVTQERFQLWVDYARNGWDMYHNLISDFRATERYNELMRQIYNVSGQNIIIEGTIDWIDRTGNYGAGTAILMSDVEGNIYGASDAEQLPLTTGDKVLIFGHIIGEGGYTSTNIYGVETEYACPTIAIDDWIVMPTTRTPNRDYYRQLTRHEGPVEMEASQEDYYYNREMNNIDSFSATEIDGHPYTVVAWYYEEAYGRYFIEFCYDEMGYDPDHPYVMVLDYYGMCIMPWDTNDDFDFGGINKTYGVMEYSWLTTEWGNAKNIMFPSLAG